MAYNTGNPSGSSDPRDLSDSSADIDTWATSTTADTHPDRLGTVRKTWHGMENKFDADQADRAQRFDLFLANSGYQFAGDYAAGIELTEYNQVLRDVSGNLWRVSASTSLPYTTTGVGLPEGGAFIAIGDADLAQNLISDPSTGQGALLVRGSVIYVDSIAELQALPTSELVDGQVAQIVTTLRQGLFKFNSTNQSTNVSNDNFDAIYVAPSSDTTGVSGAWVRQYAELEPRFYGYDGSRTDSGALLQYFEDNGRALAGINEFTGNIQMPTSGDYSGLVFNGVTITRNADRRGYYAELPDGFDWDAAGHMFWIDQYGVTRTNITPDSYDVASKNSPVEYFVKPGGAIGSTPSGTDPADPLGAIYVAFDRIETNADANAVVWIEPGLYADALNWGTSSTVTSNISIKPWNGSTTAPYYADSGDIITAAETTGLAWAATAGSAYSTSRSAVTAVIDEAIINRFADPSYYKKVDTLTECNSTAGSWYQDGTTLYVHTLNERAPDSSVRAFVEKNHGRAGSGNYTFYCERVHFLGGNIPFHAIIPDDGTEQTLCFNDCRFRYGNENGLGTRGASLTVTYNCESSYNRDDGFNYHSEFGGIVRNPYVIEVNNVAHNNGQLWSPLLGSCQGSTNHDGGYIVRAGCVYFDNDRQQVADVGDCRSLLFNVQSRAVTQPYPESRFADYYVSDGIMWLDHCIGEGCDYSLASNGPGQVKVRLSQLTPSFYAVGTNMDGY